jgi:trimeric autotransporter adhesin
MAGTTDPFLGWLSLLRVSNKAVTPEQVRWIYDQERPLFNPNAKATLGGASSLVKAICQDEKTGLLHVGTNVGRYEFSGLVNVAKSETAVTTHIAAHDGMILEQ